MRGSEGTRMGYDETSPRRLDGLVAGEQDGLPPAPQGTPDTADTPPEARFQAPAGNTPYADRTSVDDRRTPENEES